MNPITQKALVKGKVQGVFYRASTRQLAIQKQVTGYAKNLPDGSVEVVAQGSIESVADVMQWLWQGPEQSNVSAVEVTDLLTNKRYLKFTTL